MSLESYLTYLAVVLVFFATPPDTSQLLVMSNSLRHGVRRSVATIAGDLSANAIQMTAAAFGLAAIITASAYVFELVKWVGVLYLAFLGLRLVLAGPEQERAPTSPARQRIALFRQGFVTSSANPFAIVFFAALFPQFLDRSAEIWSQLALLGGTYLLVDGLVLLLWGTIAVRALAFLRAVGVRWLNRVCGALMLLGAAYLGSTDLEKQPAAGRSG